MKRVNSLIIINDFISKEADRVYAELTEKVAFQVNVDPASVTGAIAGSYMATRHYQNKLDERNEQQQPSIEEGSYNQIQDLMSNLKIIFTPINVIYSVNGQVFEIIKINEMSPSMREAFVQKNGEYFKQLLMNKINMELQMAEKVFSQRLLKANGAAQMKEAGYITHQSELLGLDPETFEKVASVTNEQLKDISGIPLPLNFDSIRPLTKYASEMEAIEKVAGIFDAFKRDPHEALDLGDLKDNVKIGFLPDRVIFLYQGQLLEQMSVVEMDETAYEAFQQKNKDFFFNVFNSKAKETSALNKALYNKEQTEKTAASLEEVVEELTEELPNKEGIDIFKDGYVHPLVYDRILSNKYGKNWVDYELEAIIKQIEIDFKLDKGLTGMVLNKISMMHTMASTNSSLFESSFTFEKFVRVMSNKDVFFDQFEGNVNFNEIMFALEIAQAYEDDDVYLTFPITIAEYVAEELYQDDIRFVSDQLYDETKEGEREFFKTVNGYLMRKWKNLDAKNIEDEDKISLHHRFTESIVTCSDKVLRNFAEKIFDGKDMIDNIRKVLVDEHIVELAPSEKREIVLNLASETVRRHFFTGMFLELKRDDFEASMIELEKENKAGEKE
jgi:hypothetical protein